MRRNRVNMNNWMRYAAWELEQKEFRRARSIFERALDVDSTAVTLWLRYIESEMKTRNINHARNLLDRAVTILPRVDKLWYKYVSVFSGAITLPWIEFWIVMHVSGVLCFVNLSYSSKFSLEKKTLRPKFVGVYGRNIGKYSGDTTSL